MAITYEPIATTTLGSAQASVTFSSISSAYTDLILVMAGQNTSSTTNYDVYMRFNSDSGTNYSTTRMYTQGGAANSDRLTSWTAVWAGYWYGTASSKLSTTITQISNYSNTTTYKPCLTRLYAVNHESTFLTSSTWRNTNAINTIVLSSPSTTFQTGSIFTLYGVKAA